jgi:hypothetical protein
MKSEDTATHGVWNEKYLIFLKILIIRFQVCTKSNKSEQRHTGDSKACSSNHGPNPTLTNLPTWENGDPKADIKI